MSGGCDVADEDDFYFKHFPQSRTYVALLCFFYTASTLGTVIKMTRPFGNSDKRFSIDDAFEEETDEAIKVYGATGDRSPLQNKFKNGTDFIASKTYKCSEDTTSRDSDSLIHEYVEATQSLYCWNHPKVRENWKTVCAAVILLLVGVGLLGMGAFAVAEPDNGLQGAVFFVAGMICFVPGAYHVVYIWLAARGQRGYDFYHLPLFT